MDIIKDFIKPELLIIVPVLYLIGNGIKRVSIINDKYIPLTLGILGIILSVIWIIANSNINSYKDILMCIFVGITQGVLTAGGAVYFNQVFVVQPKRS